MPRSHGTARACYHERRNPACDECRAAAQAADRRRGTVEYMGHEHLAKLAAAARERYRTPEARAVTSASLRRDDAGYAGAHSRLRYDRGPASEHECVDCGGPAAEWSFNHDTSAEGTRYHDGAPFSLDPADYDPRCARCHIWYDRHQEVRLAATS